MKLSQKAALVTGASRGLGRALGRRARRAGRQARARGARGRRSRGGCRRDSRRAAASPTRSRATWGTRPPPIGLAGAAAALVGPIDLLVHNASTLGPVPLAAVTRYRVRRSERVLEANLVGPFRLTKIVAGSMALRGEGVIVHVSSDAAVDAYPRWGAYGVSKAAQDHLTRQWSAGARRARRTRIQRRSGGNGYPDARATPCPTLTARASPIRGSSLAASPT